MILRRHRRRDLSEAEREAFRALLNRHLQGHDDRVPDLVGYLDYLADLDRFVFHGSNQAGIEVLSTERKSTDTRAFGSQTAVYATSDPHWAVYFALVQRSNTRSLRNGSFAFSPAARTRWYRRDVVVRDPDRPAIGEGTLYVISRETFTREPKVGRILDTAQWVSPVPVAPLFSLRVTPHDYPPGRHVRVVGSARA